MNLIKIRIKATGSFGQRLKSYLPCARNQNVSRYVKIRHFGQGFTGCRSKPRALGTDPFSCMICKAAEVASGYLTAYRAAQGVVPVARGLQR